MSTYQEAIDERLTKALEASNFRLTLIKQQENIRLKYESNLIYSKNGGLFKITKELISFISVLLSQKTEKIVLVDENENPIMFNELDLQVMLGEILIKYNEASLEYWNEYQKLRTARSTSKTVEW